MQKYSCGVIFFCSFFLLYVFVNIIYSIDIFFTSFPNNYTWTELCVNYQGGFIRRGLIGELFYYCANIINIRIIVCFSFLIIYSIYITTSLFLLKNSVDSVSLLYIVLCPGLLFFFAFDAEMLFRKDVFFETGFIMQFIILASKKISFNRSCLYIIFIYVFCLLIHESTFFYSAPCFTLLLEKAYRNQRFSSTLITVCFLMLFTFLYLFCFSGTIIQKESIVKSWESLFLLENIGALQFIGKTLDFQLHQVIDTISIKLFASIILAIIITSLPVLRIAKDQRIDLRFKHYFSFPHSEIAIFFCFFTPWILPFIANDFGRHIHTAFLNYICFFSSIIITTDNYCVKNKQCFDKKFNVFFWGWLFIYSFGWKLWHHPFKEQIITFSDPIRYFFIEIIGL